jgi:hypothetical protein
MHRVQIRYKEAARLTLASSVAVGMAIQTLARTIEFVAWVKNKTPVSAQMEKRRRSGRKRSACSGFI